MKLRKMLAVSGFLMSAPLWSATPAEQAQKILSDLHQANQLEIRMGRLAMEKGASEQMRAYGDRLVKDHETADKEVQSVAQKEGILLEAASSQGILGRYKTKHEHEKMSDLSRKSGKDFDKAFAKAMIADHKWIISTLEKAHKEIDRPEIRGLISRILPTLRQHLEIAQTLE